MTDDARLRSDGFLGGYAVDDEAVPAGATYLVENGVLKTLLTTRNPIRGVNGSTGNRRGSRAAPSNLLLTSRRGLSREELLAELMLLIEERQAEFGVIVRRLGNPGYRPPPRLRVQRVRIEVRHRKRPAGLQGLSGPTRRTRPSRGILGHSGLRVQGDRCRIGFGDAVHTQLSPAGFRLSNRHSRFPGEFRQRFGPGPAIRRNDPAQAFGEFAAPARGRPSVLPGLRPGWVFGLVISRCG